MCKATSFKFRIVPISFFYCLLTPKWKESEQFISLILFAAHVTDFPDILVERRVFVVCFGFDFFVGGGGFNTFTPFTVATG